jgi:hypothetical protein
MGRSRKRCAILATQQCASDFTTFMLSSFTLTFYEVLPICWLALHAQTHQWLSYRDCCRKCFLAHRL